jgi:arylsulfatase A-like enzyme
LREPQAAQTGQVPESQRNIIMIYTDDQRWDSLCINDDDLDELCATEANWPMPYMHTFLTDSVVFTNSFSTYPLCCPSRASLLSGGKYAHKHGVMGNRWPHGGALRFDPIDGDTLATRLQAVGYQTSHTGGKYLNQYYPEQVNFQTHQAYVPPGWNHFAVVADPTGNPNLTNDFGAVVAWDGVTETVGYTATDMLAWERQQAESFVDSVCPPLPLRCASLENGESHDVVSIPQRRRPALVAFSAPGMVLVGRGAASRHARTWRHERPE